MDIELVDLSDETYRFDKNPYTEDDPISLETFIELVEEGYITENSQPESALPIDDLLGVAEMFEEHGYTMEFGGKVVDTVGGLDTVIVSGVWCLGSITPEIRNEFLTKIAFDSHHVLLFEEEILYCSW